MGSIVSTALSAALIDTAVGLIVYRLCVLNLIRAPASVAQLCLSWRDRGKHPSPPPLYQRGDWHPDIPVPAGSPLSSFISSRIV